MTIKISDLFQHIVELINLEYYTKSECDSKYLIKQNFGLVIDDEGILRIVAEEDNDDNDDGSDVFVGELYALKSDVPTIIDAYLKANNYIHMSDLKKMLVPLTVTDSTGETRTVYVFEEDDDDTE